jgi:hypothetical protein
MEDDARGFGDNSGATGFPSMEEAQALAANFLENAQALAARLEIDYHTLIQQLARVDGLINTLADPIEDDLQAGRALDWRTEQWQPAKDALEEARLKETKPYLNCQKAVNNLFNPIIKLSAQKAAVITERLRQYNDLKRREERARELARKRAAERDALAKREEAQRLSAAAAAANDPETAAALNVQAIAANRQALINDDIVAMKSKPTHVHGSHSNTGFFKADWKFYVTDLDALPREWWCPDLVAIEEELQMALRNNGQPPTIPGVEFFNDEKFQTRKC